MRRVRQSSPGRLETENFVNDDSILVEQLRRIYLSQQKASDKLNKKNRFLRRWKFLCCL